ncbi:hypothetical protein HUJ04_005327 [Dendroctonus ponderosae]|nr:hypothetical protein HUJ04_005327 [Dendroctonus ponderosae]
MNKCISVFHHAQSTVFTTWKLLSVCAIVTGLDLIVPNRCAIWTVVITVTVNLENANVTSDGLDQGVNNFPATLDAKNTANARMARVSALKAGMDDTVHCVKFVKKQIAKIPTVQNMELA